MRAIAVTNLSADPARLLIAQSPERFLQPGLTKRGLPNAGGNAGALYDAILMTAVHNSLGIRCDIILPILPSRSVSGAGFAL